MNVEPRTLFRFARTFFFGQPQKIVTIMTGHLKDKLFVLTALQGGLWEAVQVLLGPKLALKSDFFMLHLYV